MAAERIVIELIQFKRAYASTWASLNPVLSEGEPGLEKDTNRIKIGNGVDTWNNLDYLGGSTGSVGYLNDLSDVDATLKTNRNALLSNGTDFISRPITKADISDFGTYASQTSQDTQDVNISNNAANIVANANNISINTAKISADGSINTHSDVDISSIVDGQTIIYSGNKFIPSSTSPSTQLAALTDVVSATNGNGYVLIANGTSGFVSRPLTESDISNLKNYAQLESTNSITSHFTLLGPDGNRISINSNGTINIIGGTNSTDTHTFLLNQYGASMPDTSITDINSLGNKAIPTKEYVDSASVGHTIQDEGVEVSQQPTINFIGAGVSVTDNDADNSTDVTILAGGDALTSDGLDQFASTTSTELETVISDNTGTNKLVFSDSPVLITPDLGTPSAAVLTNATGLPLSTGVTGNLSVNNLNGGTGATGSTFWAGDGTWKTPIGGSGGGSYNFSYTEIPTGLINGSNTTFTVSQAEYRSGSLVVYLDGQAMISSVGIIETDPGSGIFDFEEAPNTDQVVYVTYQLGTILSGDLVQSDVSAVPNSTKVNNHILISKEDYDSLGSYDSNTVYKFSDYEYGKAVSNTGSTIDLGYTGTNYMNMSSASGITSYITTNHILGGKAKVLINSASEPTITGATKINGDTFVSSTNMYMLVEYNGVRVEYKFETI